MRINSLILETFIFYVNQDYQLNEGAVFQHFIVNTHRRINP